MSGQADPEALRVLEALLFGSAEPLAESALATHVAGELDLRVHLNELQALYAGRGVNLVRVGDRWAFRTAQDLAGKLRIEQVIPRKLSRAAIETLAIIAYHQPVTRAEIEEIRGVSQSRGTLDVLLEAGWIKPGRRRRTPGRPVTWLTTNEFLDHFGLENLKDLPGVEELKAAGLLDARPAAQAFRGEQLDLLEDDEDEEQTDAETAEELGLELEDDGGGELVDLSETFRRSGRGADD